MASIKDVIGGLTVLAKTAKIPAGLASRREVDRLTAMVEAEHDIIYGPEANPSKEDIVELEGFSWFLDDEGDVWSIFC